MIGLAKSSYTVELNCSGAMKIVVAGGSMSGLACAHALLNIGNPDLKNELQIIVLEKAKTLTSAGAGLSLDPNFGRILDGWNIKPSFQQISAAIKLQEERVSDIKKGTYKVLAVDEKCAHRAIHWSDLHQLLYWNLPDKSIVKWGHELLSFYNKDDGSGVSVQVRDMSKQEEFTMDCDILIGADGVRSTVCSLLFPDVHNRYLGYCAWRGVYEYGDKSEEIVATLRALYPNLGNCAYCEISEGTHILLYEVEGKRINWLWYRNQIEPQLKGTSTIKLNEMQIQKMHKDARDTWMPELASLINATPSPFVNALYDRDPLQHMVLGRVALAGDAAHPTSPHCVRSTSMAISDAAALAKCLSEWGSKNIEKALAGYEKLRLPATSRDVMCSRYMGLLKQGILSSAPADWWQATEDQCKILLLKNTGLMELSDLDKVSK